MFSMNVVFRADASQVIGSGHITRCATLAAALKNHGAKVLFICRDLPGNAIAWLRSRDLEVNQLHAPEYPILAGYNEYASWLAVTMETEIRQCIAALEGRSVDWLVVDHYALDWRWEQTVCSNGINVLAIDDIANRPHACRLLLDQNCHEQASQRYADLADDADLLLGPQYALLRQDFVAYRKRLAPRSGTVEKILVFFGGSDNANVTSRALLALDAVKYLELQIDVISGQANPHLDQLRQLCQSTGANLHVQVDNMAQLMAHADLALGATGVTTWERAALGLPTLAVSIAKNQQDIAHQAHQLGLLRYLGNAESVGIDDWVKALIWACSHPEEMRRQTRSGMEIVDGMGADRVVEKMIAYHCCLH